MKIDNNSKKAIDSIEEKAILRKTVIGEDGKTYEIEEELETPSFPDDLESLKQMLKKIN